MDYLDDIFKIVMKHINDANPEVWRRGLREIGNYCKDEDMNYRIRSEHRKDKGMLL